MEWILMWEKKRGLVGIYVRLVGETTDRSSHFPQLI